MPLNALRAFEAVGRHLSFTGGANALSVTQSAMSRHVSGLEDLLGRQLFVRESSRLRLTSAGEELLPVVTRCLDQLEQTLNGIRDDDASRRPLRLHVPPTLLHQFFLPMLGEFEAVHPDIQVDVSSTGITGLPATNVDMAIAYDRPNVDDWVTDLLWMVRVVPMCSPKTAESAEGKSLQQFLAANKLLHVKLDGQPRDVLWAAYAQQCGFDLSGREGLAFDTAIAGAQYAMQSEGVLLGDVDLFGRELAEGRLVMPFDMIREDGYGYYLKLNADDLADPTIAALRSWLIARFADMPKYGDPAPA